LVAATPIAEQGRDVAGQNHWSFLRQSD
jgi:hypothetical protein